MDSANTLGFSWKPTHPFVPSSQGHLKSIWNWVFFILNAFLQPSARMSLLWVTSLSSGINCCSHFSLGRGQLNCTDVFMSAQLPPAAIPMGKWSLPGTGGSRCNDTKTWKLFIVVPTQPFCCSEWILLKLIRLKCSEVVCDCLCFPGETWGGPTLG